MRQLINNHSAAVARVFSAIICFLAAWLPQNSWAETDPKFYAVEVSASVQTAPAQITLSWPADPRGTSYKIYRKALKASSWTPITSLPGNAVGYLDASVSVGAAYEYQVAKTTSYGYAGYGYIYAGVNTPAVESRGKLILIVANTYAAELAPELARLERDLVGDGWTVLRHDVAPTDSPARVKALIQADYNADRANVRTVFLFGHVAVPYSGNFNPDGHIEHLGAWAADAYYGDMDGNWTDNSVNSTSAEKPWNRNVPGDGKFDQSELPSDVELEVGRVDLSNMTCFANKTPARSEKDLLRQYLNKDHNFRHRITQIARRGLICDNFGERNGEAFAASGWRNFAPFFGASKVSAVPGWNYFPTLDAAGYLWSYGTGGGSFYTCDGVGSSDDFATNDIQSVFMMFCGSFFGDWDNESNFLRAALGSTTYGLASAWAGRPHWFLHHMGLGETIGYGTRISQNNGPGGLYAGLNKGTRMVHVALMGDPTLRLHPVAPASNLKVAPAASGVALNWTASPDSDIQGYHIYRADSAKGPFARVSGAAPIAGTSYSDPAGSAQHTYMVRAIKLEQASSGSYFNPSQGIFSSDIGTVPVQTPPVVTPTVPGTPSSPVQPTGPAQAVFVKMDTSTGGNWRGLYGADGFQIMSQSVKYPSYAVVTSNGKQDYVWKDSTSDARALQKADASDRIASCWYADSGFSAEIAFVDGQTHRLALYSLDWDTNARGQTVEVLDTASGALLDRQTLTGFNRGVYLVWDIKGTVTVRFQKLSGYNAVLMGIFFDPAAKQLATPAPNTTSPALSAAKIASGKFQVRVVGAIGQKFVIQASIDCVGWTPVSEVTLSSPTFDFTDENAANYRMRYYRAVPVP